MTPDDQALEILIRARLAARGTFESEELAGAVAEAARLAQDAASLRAMLRPGDSPERLMRVVARARSDGR